MHNTNDPYLVELLNNGFPNNPSKARREAQRRIRFGVQVAQESIKSMTDSGELFSYIENKLYLFFIILIIWIFII